MKQENKDFLEQHRPIYDMLVKAGIVTHLDNATREGILRVIREEWDGGYMINTWCQSCVVDMIKYAYVQLEKFLATLPPPEPLQEGERIVEMTFPVQEPTAPTAPEPPNEAPPINKKTKRRR